MLRAVDINDLLPMPVDHTSESVAYAFAHKYKGRLYYHQPQKKWFWRLGTKWQKDRSAMAFNFARIICRELNTKGKPYMGKASFVAKVERNARLLFSEGGYNAGGAACPNIDPPTNQELNS